MLKGFIMDIEIFKAYDPSCIKDGMYTGIEYVIVKSTSPTRHMPLLGKESTLYIYSLLDTGEILHHSPNPDGRRKYTIPSTDTLIVDIRGL